MALDAAHPELKSLRETAEAFLRLQEKLETEYHARLHGEHSSPDDGEVLARLAAEMAMLSRAYSAVNLKRRELYRTVGQGPGDAK